MGHPTLSLLQIVVLALLQGVTEFLPISSSAHLILVPALTDWPDQGLELDIAVHVGSLGAVLLYLRAEVRGVLAGCAGIAAGRRGPEERLALALLTATVPLLLAGGMMVALDLTEAVRSPLLIAAATVVFALLLYAADRGCRSDRGLGELGTRQALFIGLMQIVALLPGTSRAGITITAARMLGLERREAARFSMLLAVPAILAPGAYLVLKVLQSGEASFGLAALLAGGLAFVAALAAIWLMMRWLERASYTPFVLYRLALGAGLFYWLAAG